MKNTFSQSQSRLPEMIDDSSWTQRRLQNIIQSNETLCDKLATTGHIKPNICIFVAKRDISRREELCV